MCMHRPLTGGNIDCTGEDIIEMAIEKVDMDIGISLSTISEQKLHWKRVTLTYLSKVIISEDKFTNATMIGQFTLEDVERNVVLQDVVQQDVV